MDLLATPTKGKINVIVVGILAIIALAGGIGAYFYLNQPADKPKIATIKDDTLVGKRRPDFSLQDVDGKQRTLSEWDGKVLIVNFWATWCPPCRREIPAFIELQEHYESKGFAINYPVLIADVDGIAISQQYGNKLGVLPFTVIVDRKGIIRHSLAREVEKEEAEKLILPLLSQN
jgi:thiol-disulfide isomerase/thioredoxin